MQNLGAEQTLDGWISVASLYAKHIDPITGVYAKKALEMLPVNENDKVLDVATGAGALALRAAEFNANVNAIDFTPPLIDILQKKAEDNNLDNIEAEVMDGTDLEFKDNTFDAAFSVFGLMLFDMRDKGFKELNRVLSPGGKAMVVTWDAPPNNDWMEIFQEAITSAFPGIPKPPAPSFLELADKKQLKKEMKEAGFEDVGINSWSSSSSWENAEEAWVAIAKSNPIFTPLIKKIGPEGARHLKNTFDEKLKERFGDGYVEVNATAHYGLGTA